MDAKEDFRGASKMASEVCTASEYHGIKIPEELKSEIQRKIGVLFEEQRVYLDQHLTLAKLSSMVGTNSAYLSSMVNYLYGCNLPTLVNGYRIRHSQRLLVNNNVNIKDVYKACGFASRSVFYAAFQKETGTTPSVFVKRLNR